MFMHFLAAAEPASATAKRAIFVTIFASSVIQCGGDVPTQPLRSSALGGFEGERASCRDGLNLLRRFEGKM